MKTVEAIKASLNKKILGIDLTDNKLTFSFTDASELVIFDDGQSCCEERYMTTDDNIKDYEGSVLLGIVKKEGPTIGEIDEVHEVEFLDIVTDKGTFQLSSHNEHNGYYNGFAIVAQLQQYI